MPAPSDLLVTLPLHSLLLLRLALNDAVDNTDIAQDINDLYLFPERLTDSYPDEWRAYVRRRLVQLKLSLDDLQQLDSARSQNSETLRALVMVAQPRYKTLLKVLEEVQTCRDCEKVQVLPTPLHKWLAWAIS